MKEHADKEGKVVVVSGPSGVGKSTICRQVAERMESVCLSVSVTTRPRAEGEIDGRDYWFVSEEDFDKRLRESMLLESAEVFGNRYGTPKDKMDQAIKEGKIVLLEIDVQGGRQVQVIYPDAVMIFILPPTHKTLVERINHRGRENSDAAEERVNGAGSEIAAAWQYYKHMVINDDLEQAVTEVMDIIKGLKAS